MKTSRVVQVALFALLFFATAVGANAQPQFTLSQNVYRIPYDDGELVNVNHDVFTHSPLGRYDLKAQGVNDCNTHRIVAAAPGVVEFVVDNNSQSCPTCGASNNYVWIRHTNNEWTKYTHFAQNSVAVAEGDTVCSGTFLGYECWIGATSPAQNRHLHFEVRQPLDPANVIIAPAGGFMDSLDGYHLIPVLTTVANHYVVQGDLITASAASACTVSTITIPGQTFHNGDIKIYIASDNIGTAGNSITCNNGSNVFLQAGSVVTLLPGFQASAGSYFHAKTGGCVPTPFPGGCH